MAEDPGPAAITKSPSPEEKPSTENAPASAGTPPAAVPMPDTGYTPAGVPTLDGVREKIETRLGTALGATELAEETPEGRTAAQQFDARQKAAEAKLEEIRASMPDKGGLTP
jgi:hypothetical protein